MNQTSALARTGIGLVGVAALALAACGGGSGSNATAASSSAAKLVSVKKLSGRSVLVSSGGRAIYTPSQENSGKIKCTGGCAAVWVPVKAGSAKARKDSGIGHLGTVARPGGKKQLSYRGHPLYTFAHERPGKVTGDGLKDSFAGRKFTWHVVKAGRQPAKPKAKQPAPGGGAYGGY